MSGSDDSDQEDRLGTESPDTAAELADLAIKCIDCKNSFIWSAGEQIFFQQKNLVNPPKRCKPCKRAKNQRISAIEKARLSDKRHHVVMSAECAQCGKITTIPFYPSQGRPVFCRPCFQNMKSEDKAEAKSA